MVSTAVHLVSKQVNLPLKDMMEDVRAGALLSPERLKELHPGYEGDLLGAIEMEIKLLQAAGGMVDRYYAFRLGALGGMIVEYTSPMRTAPAAYRNLYYADVDKSIQSVRLDPPRVRSIEYQSYFAERAAAASANDAMILREYTSGTGFSGMASRSLPQDALRSASAVAEVWYTLLAGNRVVADVSEKQMQKYVLEAYSFYIRGGHLAELKRVSERIDRLAPFTADMHVAVGDLYSAAGVAENAVASYELALEMAPERKEVVEKVSAYYAQAGQAALDEDRLEEALRCFDAALSANPLHMEAEAGRLDAVKRIEAREARLANDRATLDQGASYEDLAEEEASRGRYAEAISLLRQASATYAQVGTEFLVEGQRAQRAVNDIAYRIQELKQSIMENAQAYSGKGFALDLDVLIREQGKELDAQTLERLLQNTLKREMMQVEEDLGAKLAIE